VSNDKDNLAEKAGLRAERHRASLRDGEPSVARRLTQIGVLGWIVVVPLLVGLFLGRWADQSFGTGIFWTAPGLLLGLGLGCWSAWRWMHTQ
jgi:ATP synthase protein I